MIYFINYESQKLYSTVYNFSMHQELVHSSSCFLHSKQSLF